MDTGLLEVILLAVGGTVGWFGKQYWYWRKARRQSTHDLGDYLNERKVLFEEQLAKTNDSTQKKNISDQIDGVVATLLALNFHKVKRTLKDAGYPPEEELIAEGLSKLKPKQITELEAITKEIEALKTSISERNLFVLANSYYHLGRPQNAKIIYDQILALNPNNAEALNNRGVINAHLEEEDEN